MEKRIVEVIPILGMVSVNFRGLSAQIYNLYEKEDEIARQKNMAHLGIISEAFKSSNHNRFEYLILQCVLSELIENNFRGTTIAQGSIKINGESYQGNEIIKSWFLLSNFGHCKNTIADEKTLLIKALQSKKFKTFLLSLIKDNELKSWANVVIDEFDYIHFHYVLSIIRVYKCLRKNVFQTKLITLFKLLLFDVALIKAISNAQGIQRLKSIFSNMSIDLLSTVLSYNFYEDRYRQTDAGELLAPLVSLLCDHLYLNIKTQAHQRAYELKAIQSVQSTYECINIAFNEGLANVEPCHLEHFLRIKLHTDFIEDTKLKDALRITFTVKRGLINGEASLDNNPYTNIRIFDFYLNRNHAGFVNLPRFLFNITAIIESQVKGTVENKIKKHHSLLVKFKPLISDPTINKETKEKITGTLGSYVSDEAWKEIRSQNIPAYKEILWSVLRYFISEGLYFDIEHHTEKDYPLFGVKASGDEDYLTDRIETAIKLSPDPDRQHELKQLLKATNHKFDGIVIGCLVRVKIFEYSKAPNERPVTDIDAIALKFSEDKLILELHESKNTKNPYRDARKDLSNKLIGTINRSKAKVEIREVKGYGAKMIITPK